jgi:RNA polymerase sigma factor (sigma-70 family)
VQEAWLDAWRGLGRFEPGRPFRPWLLALVANRCRRAARRWAPSFVPLDEFAESQGQWDDQLGQTLDAEVGSALGLLSPDQRRVVALRFFADLELAEIAGVTATPLGTVKSRLHRALALLRASLDPARAAVPAAAPEKEAHP